MATIIVEKPPEIPGKQVRDTAQETDTSQHELGRMALTNHTVRRKCDELGILSLSISPEIEQSPTVRLLFTRTVSTRSSP